jgi:hypothetical protein
MRTETLDAQTIMQVYKMLQNREIHPSGTFDGGGRFHATHWTLINVRAPSRQWPYSHMLACRTLKYVKAVAAHFKCTNIDELIKKV